MGTAGASALELSAVQTCSKCGLTKEVSAFAFRSDTHRRRGTCKECLKAYQRRRYAEAHPSAGTGGRLVTAESLRCNRCGEMKAGSDFPLRNHRSNRVHSWCRECFSKYKAQRYVALRPQEILRLRRNHDRVVAENRERIAQYLSQHPCADCGESDLRVLDFDHLRDKLMDVKEMMHNGWPWRRILEEIEKCQVRCANCHRRRTSERRVATSPNEAFAASA